MLAEPSPRVGRALVNALRMLLAFMLAFATAAIAPAQPSSAIDPSDGLGAVRVSVAPEGFEPLEDGEPLRLSVAISNETGETLDAGHVSVRVTVAAVPSGGELSSWLRSASTAGARSANLGGTVTPQVAPGTTRFVDLTLPTSTLPFSEPGVYALEVEVESGGEVVGEARTPVVWQAAGNGSVPFAIAAPLVVPASSAPLIDAETLESYTSPGGILNRQLDAMEATSVAIGIDPRIIASIRVLGADAPPSATQWLERLEGVANETFPLAWADADLTLPLRAGTEGLLQPTSLDFAIDPGRFAPDTSGEQQPSTPDPPDEPTPLPSGDDLTAWNYDLPDLAWPAAGSLVEGDLPRLSEHGFTSAIMHEADLTRSGSPTPQAATKVEEFPVAMADAELSRHLNSAVAASTTAEWAAATAELSAALALANEASAGQAPILLATLDRHWPDSGYRLLETAEAIAAQPWVAGSTLASAIAARPVSGEIVETTVNEPRVDRVRQLLGAEASEQRFSAIAADPEALTAPRRLALLALLSNAWRADPAGWQAATEEFLLRSRDIRTSVQIVDSSTINLLTDEGALPVTVSNALDQPVTVYITVRPQSAILTVQESRVELTIEPNSQKRGTVPVTSLSNGEVRVSVALHSASGAQIGGTTEVEINVQAGWETAGTLLFAGIVVAVFAVGLIRNIRKRRRPAGE